MSVSSEFRPTADFGASSMKSPFASAEYSAIISFAKLPMTMLARPDPS